MEFLGEFHGIPPATLRPHFYEHREAEAVRHLFRVIASLDSLIVGEGQIAGQVNVRVRIAQEHASVGPVLHALLQHARLVAKRVRTETGISRGNVSVSSAAVDYVRQVFAHFGDKTVLVIGAGKMGERALRHLQELKPQRILVANRSPDKAAAVAGNCGGIAVPWEMLDDALAKADIILSSTGAKEPIVTRQRWEKVLARKGGVPAVILDIAVPAISTRPFMMASKPASSIPTTCTRFGSASFRTGSSTSGRRKQSSSRSRSGSSRNGRAAAMGR